MGAEPPVTGVQRPFRSSLLLGLAGVSEQGNICRPFLSDSPGRIPDFSPISAIVIAASNRDSQAVVKETWTP